jgi:cytochrome b pre-mRNA-processing protein 3
MRMECMPDMVKDGGIQVRCSLATRTRLIGKEIGLPQTFNSYAMVCFLHIWILKVRLRQWPKSMSDHLSKMLSDHFFWRAEEHMDFVHKLGAQERHKHMDHFFQVWTGTLIAYDEGLVKGDAVLATAIWRLLFQANKEVDPLKVELVTRYARKEIARLAWLEDDVFMKGYVGFGEPVKPWEAEYKQGSS